MDGTTDERTVETWRGRTTYAILVNVQSTVDPTVDRALHGYRDGDLLVATWRDEIDGVEGTADGMRAACERLFVRHNIDSRPDGQVGPSLSVGDVVAIGETSWAVRDVGFEMVGTPSNVEPDDGRTWLEIVRAERLAR